MTPEEKAIGSLALVGEGMSVTASDLVDNSPQAVTLSLYDSVNQMFSLVSKVFKRLNMGEGDSTAGAPVERMYFKRT